MIVMNTSQSEIITGFITIVYWRWDAAKIAE